MWVAKFFFTVNYNMKYLPVSKNLSIEIESVTGKRSENQSNNLLIIIILYNNHNNNLSAFQNGGINPCMSGWWCEKLINPGRFPLPPTAKKWLLQLPLNAQERQQIYSLPHRVTIEEKFAVSEFKIVTQQSTRKQTTWTRNQQSYHPFWATIEEVMLNVLVLCPITSLNSPTGIFLCVIKRLSFHRKKLLWPSVTLN